MCICVYVFMCICVYVFMCICVYVCERLIILNCVKYVGYDKLCIVISMLIISILNSHFLSLFVYNKN